jgi:mycothiol S-conjugate amidase
MAQVRRDEMRAAQEILGIEHTWLGFVDSGLPEGDPLPPLPEGCFAAEPIDVTTEALVRVIREFRPHVLLTYDETGGYPHPDHVNCHVVSMSAFAAAGDSDAYPNAGEPWQPLKLYYLQTTSRERIQRLYDLMVERGIDSDYGEWLTNWKRPEREVTTRVKCAEYYDLRDRALLAHATQVDPDGGWFHAPRDLVREGWPTEDYELVVSYAPVQLPEDDLFAGLGSVREADALAVKGGLEPVRDLRPDPQGARELLASTSGPAG